MAIRNRSVMWLLLVVIGLSQIHCDEDVIEKSQHYTVDTFPVEITKNNHFVMFYAPWCTHCKRLHPTWEDLAKIYNNENSKVTIAKVDCTTDTSLCSDHDVTGYPTLKFFALNEKEGVKFRQTRDLPSLTNFINEQLGTSEENLDEEKVHLTQSGLVEMTDKNYENYLSSGNHFVKFYAPWCGHCQRLAPTWDALANTFVDDKGINIAKIDCTVNRDACKSYDIKSYPTLLWIQDGQKLEKYQGGRSLEELKSWVNEMKGSTKGGPDISSSTELPPSPVVPLTSENFHKSISSGLTFVKFYAPWCGHCKRLAQTWEELGRKFSAKHGISIAKVDCTVQHNKELCNQQEVDGFPTLVLYREGKKLSEYIGTRGLEELFEFVDKNSSHDEL